MTDTEIMDMIVQEVAQLYNGDKLVKGLLYFHDISQARMGGLALKVSVSGPAPPTSTLTTQQHFHYFEKLCGKDAFANVALITTKWLKHPSYEESERQLQREEELRTKYWKNMVRHGSYVERHDGSMESARRILTLLYERPNIVLRTTKERDGQKPLMDDEHALGAEENTDRADQPPTYYKVTIAQERRSRSTFSTLWDGFRIAWLFIRLLYTAFVDVLLLGVLFLSNDDNRKLLWILTTLAPALTLALFVRVPYLTYWHVSS